MFQITSMAFSPDHKPQRPHSEMGIGEVWKTETILRNTDTFHMIFVAETKSKDISLKSLGIEGKINLNIKMRSLAFYWFKL